MFTANQVTSLSCSVVTVFSINNITQC